MSGSIRTGEYYPTELESTLPDPASPSASVIYENKIHIIGSEYAHYSWNETSWTQESTLPFYGLGTIAVVYNNKIHILGGSNSDVRTNHYSWNGTSWTQESTLPGDGTYDTKGSVVVYNNKIYVYDRSSFGLISWNGSTWTTEVQRYSPPSSWGARLVVYNNKIHFLGGNVMDGGSTKHYSWNGASWNEESTLPYAFSGYTAIVYDNKIHILGNTDWMHSGDEYVNVNKYHYSWDGSTWEAEPLLPCNAPETSVVYNNKIHVLYDYWDSEAYHKHYSLSGKIDLGTKKIKRAWFPVKSGYKELDVIIPEERISTLPYAFNEGAAVVLNDEIHILGGNGIDSEIGLKHYKYSNDSWVSVSTLPYQFYSGSAIVYNNEIHILGCFISDHMKKHYKYSNGSWVSASTLPYEFYHGSVVVYDGKIHILGDAYAYGSTSYYKRHYSWNGTSWTEESTLPYNFYSGSAVIYDGEIHILGGGGPGYTKHYRYSNGEWTLVSTLPYNFYSGAAVILNGRIHILGSGYQGQTYAKEHYSFNDGEWIEEPNLPYNFYSGAAVVQNNQIHIFGSNNSLYRQEHYTISRIDTESAGKPVLTYENKSVRRAWIMTQNQGLKLVLKPISSYFKYFNCPVSFRGSFYDSAAIKHNGKIHVLSNKYHYSFDGLRWALEEQDLLPFINTRNVVSVNGKINVLGTYDSTTGNYTKEHWSWNGSSWRKLVDLPITFGQDGACCVVEEKTTGNPPYVHIFLGYDHYGINPDTGYDFQVISNPYNFHYGIVYYDPELRGLDGSIVMVGGSSSSTYANRIYHYNLNAQTVEALWVRNNYDFPESIGNGYSSAVVLYDEDHARYGDYAYIFTGFDCYRLEEGTYLRNYTSVLEGNNIATGCMFNNELHVMMSNSDQYESAAEDYWTQGLSFSKISNLPKFRSSYQFLNLEGKIHTFYGSYNANLSPSNNTVHYSLDDDVWSVEPFSVLSPSTIIIMLDEIKASVSHDGNIVCIASYSISNIDAVDVYVYYSSSGKWKSVRQNLSNEQLYNNPNTLRLNEENNRLVSCNGKLYLMGCYWRDNSGTYVAVSENMGDTWSIISGSAIPQKVRRGDAAVVGNRIHIVADDSSSGVYYHYYYDTVANEWALASTNLPYVNNTSNKKPIIGVLNDKLYALVRSTQDSRNIYNLYHFKGSGWVLDYDNIDSGPSPITRMVEADGNFYLFSEHEVYKTNFENYFT